MRPTMRLLLALVPASLAFATPARADLVLSQVVVDLTPDAPPRTDIEAWNDGTERMYVIAEPAEVVAPGTPGEHRVSTPDPAALGLLVTPQKLILEPGQRELIRIASIAPRSTQERIYRITVKPVAGEVKAAGSALKILIGYDVLVIVRPSVMTGTVTAQRSGARIVLRNDGTTNVELYEGRQCAAGAKDCKTLPPKRLYAGASWEQPIDPSRPVEYKIKTGKTTDVKTF